MANFDQLQSEMAREQDHYWNRFMAFAGLHAGLFVLLSVPRTDPPWPLYVFAAFLGVLWLYIQTASLWYVRRVKPLYHTERERIGIIWPRSSFDRLPSTKAGLAVPAAVTVLWFVHWLWP